MSPEGASDFLRLFGSGRAAAEEEYGRLRRRLILFFARRNCATADDLADEVIARVLEKFRNETDIRAVTNYAFKVASYVMLEWLRAEEAQTRAYSNLPDAPPHSDPDLKQCLERCLTYSLSSENLELLMRFSLREQSRKQLAESLNVKRSVLIGRVFRARRRVAECLQDCLYKKSRNKSDLLAHILGRRRRKA
jgi:DNA-directed RNA polymerase specialized sigma24 family protein